MSGGSLAGRVALLTGASRGIGAAVARRFAAEGAHVMLIARTVGGLEEVDDAIRAEGGSATLVPLDLTDFGRIDALGPSLLQRFQRLDVLVAAAGLLGTLSPLGHVEPAVWRSVIDVNLTANWRLIRILDPLLRRSDAGRAIFVTAEVARAPRAYWGPYAAAKAALEALALTWASESAKSSLRVNLVDPGPVATALRAQAYPGEDASLLRRPDEITGAFVDLAAAKCTDNGRLLRLGN